MLTSSSGPDTFGAPPIVKPRPSPTRFGKGRALFLFVLDVLAALCALTAAELLEHQHLAEIVHSGPALRPVALGVLFWVLAFDRLGMYRRSLSIQSRDEVYAAFAAALLSLAPAALLFAFYPALQPFRASLLIATAFTAIGVAIVRFAAHAGANAGRARRARTIAVVGAPQRVRGVPSELSLFEDDTVVSFSIEDFDDEVASVLATGSVGDISWLRAAIERGCNEIIITEALPPALMPELLALTESSGIKIAFAPMRIRPYACDFSVRRDGGLALLYPRRVAICTPTAELTRRIFDLVLTLPALALLAPLLAVVALAVYLDSGAPVFYRQTRVGRNGKTFEIFKFRTMRPDAESSSGPVWAQEGEKRTTRIGRFLRRSSLDELPQFFNVVRGDMSLVGPRPERPFYVEQFRKLLPRYDERHLVRPGITGWSHVNMRRNVDTSAIGERLSYDLFYLEHWSIFMDVLILCKTAAEFLFHSAA